MLNSLVMEYLKKYAWVGNSKPAFFEIYREMGATADLESLYSSTNSRRQQTLHDSFEYNDSRSEAYIHVYFFVSKCIFRVWVDIASH